MIFPESLINGEQDEGYPTFFPFANSIVTLKISETE